LEGGIRNTRGDNRQEQVPEGLDVTGQPSTAAQHLAVFRSEHLKKHSLTPLLHVGRIEPAICGLLPLVSHPVRQIEKVSIALAQQPGQRRRIEQDHPGDFVRIARRVDLKIHPTERVANEDIWAGDAQLPKHGSQFSRFGTTVSR
jgi:hypothetical protein